MKITTLLENTSARPELSAEHGLSLYIETAEHRILFDMGQTALFSHNASVLGIDLAAVDIAILSHGHYDHGGGLTRFLTLNRTAPIYVNRHAFEPHYNGTEKYIGLDTALAHHRQLVFIDDTTVLADGITLCCRRQAKPNHPLGAFGLTMLEDGVFDRKISVTNSICLWKKTGKRFCSAAAPTEASWISSTGSGPMS